MIHIVPVRDLIEHELTPGCVCGPDEEIIDPETGESYDGRSVVWHHSLDGREYD